MLVVLALLYLLARVFELGVPMPSFDGEGDAAPGAWYTVRRVVDGDTLLLDNRERVRLIGVDTPETVRPDHPVERFGPEASAFTKRLAERQRVRLILGQERQDKYGRTLAFVYLADGRLLNEEIIRQGYGHAYIRHPFDTAMMDRFRAAEREARAARRGLWAR